MRIELDPIFREHIEEFHGPIRNIKDDTIYVGAEGLESDEVPQIVLLAGVMEKLSDPGQVWPYFLKELKSVFPNPSREDLANCWRSAAEGIIEEYETQLGAESYFVDEISVSLGTIRQLLLTDNPHLEFETDSEKEYEECKEFKGHSGCRIKRVCPAPRIGRAWYEAAREVIARPLPQGRVY